MASPGRVVRPEVRIILSSCLDNQAYSGDPPWEPLVPDARLGPRSCTPQVFVPSITSTAHLASHESHSLAGSHGGCWMGEQELTGFERHIALHRVSVPLASIPTLATSVDKAIARAPNCPDHNRQHGHTVPLMRFPTLSTVQTLTNAEPGPCTSVPTLPWDFRLQTLPMRWDSIVDSLIHLPRAVKPLIDSDVRIVAQSSVRCFHLDSHPHPGSTSRTASWTSHPALLTGTFLPIYGLFGRL